MDTRLPAYYAALCYLMKGVLTMAYAYGMRFDDDSNAITVIDEDNQTAVTTGYIDGEYVEFGGENPNHVQTITGTATNPFGDGNIDYYTNLAQAIQNKTATVIVHMGTAQILGIDLDMYIDSIGAATFHGRYAFLPSDTNYMSFEAEWDRINETSYLHSVSKESGYVDGSAYSAGIQTVTTIVWHPLPKE